MIELEHYGDIIELNIKFKQQRLLEEIESFETIDWMPTKTREYIDLTGDREDYKSKSHSNYNENMENTPHIKEFCDMFPDVHKVRLQKLMAGSYFEPHRDHFEGGQRFRILVPINNTTRKDYAFFYEDRIFEFKPSTAYIINTRKIHGAFCFADNTYHLLLSINKTNNSLQKVINNITFS